MLRKGFRRRELCGLVGRAVRCHGLHRSVCYRSLQRQRGLRCLARGQSETSLSPLISFNTASGATPQRRVASDATCRNFCTDHTCCFACAFDNDKDCFTRHPANTPSGWSTCPFSSGIGFMSCRCLIVNARKPTAAAATLLALPRCPGAAPLTCACPPRAALLLLLLLLPRTPFLDSLPVTPAASALVGHVRRSLSDSWGGSSAPITKAGPYGAGARVRQPSVHLSCHRSRTRPWLHEIIFDSNTIRESFGIRVHCACTCGVVCVCVCVCVFWWWWCCCCWWWWWVVRGTSAKAFQNVDRRLCGLRIDRWERPS